MYFSSSLNQSSTCPFFFFLFFRFFFPAVHSWRTGIPPRQFHQSLHRRRLPDSLGGRRGNCSALGGLAAVHERRPSYQKQLHSHIYVISVAAFYCYVLNVSTAGRAHLQHVFGRQTIAPYVSRAAFGSQDIYLGHSVRRPDPVDSKVISALSPPHLLLRLLFLLLSSDAAVISEGRSCEVS